MQNIAESYKKPKRNRHQHHHLHRRLATAWIHCAGSATYQVTDPEAEP